MPPLAEVVERSTSIPAKLIGKPALGTLSVGAEADVAGLALEEGAFPFVDSFGVDDRLSQTAYAENVIVDHCSVSWTLDEAVNTYHGTKNITVQWCLISESLHDSRVRKGHGFAASLGGVNASYHHNLLANNAGRNPSIAGGGQRDPSINLDFRNNVIFNWAHRTLDGRPHGINVVNNFYKAGPASREGLSIVKIQSLHDGTFGRWYIQGNVFEDRSGSRTQNDLVKIDAANVSPGSVMIDEPFDFASVSTQTAEEAFEDVLRYAGAIGRKGMPSMNESYARFDLVDRPLGTASLQVRQMWEDGRNFSLLSRRKTPMQTACRMNGSAASARAKICLCRALRI